MKKYIIQVDFGSQGYTQHGGIFVAVYEFLKNLNSGAYVKVTKNSDYNIPYKKIFAWLGIVSLSLVEYGHSTTAWMKHTDGILPYMLGAVGVVGFWLIVSYSLKNK